MQMDMYTLMSDGIVGEHRKQFEEIVLRSNSSVVASIPYVFVLVLTVYFLISMTRDDCDNVCNNEDSVVELTLIDLDHHELSSHHPH